MWNVSIENGDQPSYLNASQENVAGSKDHNISKVTSNSFNNVYIFYLGMDVSWFKSRDRVTNFLSGSRNRSISDTIIYSCPSQLLTHDGRRNQVVTCIWHRQTDTMLWWPQVILPCNSKYSGRALRTREQ